MNHLQAYEEYLLEQARQEIWAHREILLEGMQEPWQADPREYGDYEQKTTREFINLLHDLVQLPPQTFADQQVWKYVNDLRSFITSNNYNIEQKHLHQLANKVQQIGTMERTRLSAPMLTKIDAILDYKASSEEIKAYNQAWYKNRVRTPAWTEAGLLPWLKLA